MTEFTAYKVVGSEVMQGLVKLIETVYSKGNRLLIYCSDGAKIQQLDNFLWTFKQLAFIPHATIHDEQELKLEDQPILFTNREDNINKAEVLLFLDEPPLDISQFTKVLYMFSANEQDVSESRINKIKEGMENCRFMLQLPNMSWKQVMSYGGELAA